MFRFKQFSVENERAALKVGTDAVLLGAAMTLPTGSARVLDIGTGTGVIALMVAQRCPGAVIDAIDIDPPSVLEAADNFAGSPWSGRLGANHSALQDWTGTGYDCIFSNPPFFEDSLRNPDSREAQSRHTDSLSYRDVLAFASAALAPEGTVSMILPAGSERMLLREAASRGLFPFRLLRISSTASKPPRRIIAEFSRRRVETRQEALTLQDGASRSEEYSALTNEFYL